MYEDFYHLNRNPFRLTPDPAFRYEHPSYQLARYSAEEAISRGEGFVVVTGASGTGKTTLAEELALRVTDAGRDVCRVNSTQVEADDLLRLVAFGFGIDAARGSKASVQTKLEKYLLKRHQSGLNALVIIDEAQDLTPRALEELRLLSNLQSSYESLLQILLVGQERLRYTLQRPETGTIQQRVVGMCELKALEPAQVRGYIAHRLLHVGWRGDPRMSGDAIRHIHQFTQGVPRRINVVMSRLLMHGGIERYHSLDTADVCEVLDGMAQDNLVPISSGEDNLGLRTPGLATPLRPLDSRTVEEFEREKAVSSSASRTSLNGGRFAVGRKRFRALVTTQLARLGRLPLRAGVYVGPVSILRRFRVPRLEISAADIVPKTADQLREVAVGGASLLRRVSRTVAELGRQLRFLSRATPFDHRRVLAGTAAVGVVALATAIYALVPGAGRGDVSEVDVGAEAAEVTPIIEMPTVASLAVLENSVFVVGSPVIQSDPEIQTDDREAEPVTSLARPGLDMAALPGALVLRPSIPTVPAAVGAAHRSDGAGNIPLVRSGDLAVMVEPSPAPATVEFAELSIGGFVDDIAVAAAEVNHYSGLDVNLLPVTASGTQDSNRGAERSVISFLPPHQYLGGAMQDFSLQPIGQGAAAARSGGAHAKAGALLPAQNEEDHATTREVSTAELLVSADKAMLENRFTIPGGNNAGDYYRQVLARDPGNAHALAGISEIVRTYHEMARAKLDAADSAAAQRFIGRGLRLEPTSPRLLALQAEIALLNSPAKIAGNLPEDQPVLTKPVAPKATPTPARAAFDDWLGDSSDSLSIIH